MFDRSSFFSFSENLKHGVAFFFGERSAKQAVVPSVTFFFPLAPHKDWLRHLSFLFSFFFERKGEGWSPFFFCLIYSLSF